MGNFSLSRSRIGILGIAIIVFLLIFGMRLVDLQAVHASTYAAKASEEMITVSTALAPRGAITDMYGVEFARSVAAVSVVVDQTMVKNPKMFAQIAAPILKMPAGEIKIMATGKLRWNMIARNVTPAQWRQLKSAFEKYNASLIKNGSAKEIFGFYAERGFIREYPSGPMIASLIGFVNQAGTGAAGLEYSLNSVVAGKNGKYSYANGYGAQIPGSQQEIVAAKPGTTLRLTIDRDVQWIAQQAIARCLR